MEYTYNIEPFLRKVAEQGLSYADLAEKAGVHISTVRYALGGGKARPPTMKAIADSLGVDLAQLVVPVDAENAT